MESKTPTTFPSASCPPPQLPYCAAVVSETLRLHPPGATTIRLAESEMVLGGVRIPAGSTIQVRVVAVGCCEAAEAAALDELRQQHRDSLLILTRGRCTFQVRWVSVFTWQVASNEV